MGHTRLVVSACKMVKHLTNWLRMWGTKCSGPAFCLFDSGVQVSSAVLWTPCPRLGLERSLISPPNRGQCNTRSCDFAGLPVPRSDRFGTIRCKGCVDGSYPVVDDDHHHHYHDDHYYYYYDVLLLILVTSYISAAQSLWVWRDGVSFVSATTSTTTIPTSTTTTITTANCDFHYYSYYYNYYNYYLYYYYSNYNFYYFYTPRTNTTHLKKTTRNTL